MSWHGGVMEKNVTELQNNYTFGIAKIGMVIKQKFKVYYYQSKMSSLKYSTMQIGFPANGAIETEDHHDEDLDGTRLNKVN